MIGIDYRSPPVTLLLLKPGAPVVMSCPGKAEDGSRGTILDGPRRYRGPRMYSEWEYRVEMVSPGCTSAWRSWVRATWLCPDQEGGDG